MSAIGKLNGIVLEIQEQGAKYPTGDGLGLIGNVVSEHLVGIPVWRSSMDQGKSRKCKMVGVLTEGQG